MRNLLAFLAVLVMLFAGLGWWRNWYSVEKLPSAESGKFAFRVEFNPFKIGTDVRDLVRSARGTQEKPETAPAEAK